MLPEENAGPKDKKLENYKGIYFADQSSKFFDPETGAHFSFEDLCQRLKELQKSRSLLQPSNSVVAASAEPEAAPPMKKDSIARNLQEEKSTEPGRMGRAAADAAKKLNLVLSRLAKKSLSQTHGVRKAVYRSKGAYRPQHIPTLGADSNETLNHYDSQTKHSAYRICKPNKKCSNRPPIRQHKLDLEKQIQMLIKSKTRYHHPETEYDSWASGSAARPLNLSDIMAGPLEVAPHKHCPSECAPYSRKGDLSFELVCPQHIALKKASLIPYPLHHISRNLAQKQNRTIEKRVEGGKSHVVTKKGLAPRESNGANESTREPRNYFIINGDMFCINNASIKVDLSRNVPTCATKHRLNKKELAVSYTSHGKYRRTMFERAKQH